MIDGAQPPSSPHRFATWQIALLFALLALLQGLVYAFVIPPWLSPDEHGHFEFAALMAQLGRIPDNSDISPQLQQEAIESMRAARLWQLAFHHPPPPETVDSFLADRDLAHSGRQVGNEPPLYYVFAAAAYLLAEHQSIETQLYAMRLVSVVMTSITGALAALAACDLFPRRLDMQLLVPSLVVFHPMLTYIGVSVNNDILGVLLASLLFWILVRLARHGVQWRRLAALLIVALLGLISSPQCFFVLPFLLLIGLGVLLRQRRLRWTRVALAIGAVVIAIMVIALAAIPTEAAQGWAVQPGFYLAETTTTTARSGSRALALYGAPHTSMEAVGRVSEQLNLLRGQRVHASAYVRAGSGTVECSLFVRDNTGTTAVPFTANEEWIEITAAYDVPQQASFFTVGLMVEPTEQTLYVDDLSLALSEGGQANLLSNSGAESTVSLLDRLLADKAYLRLGLPWNLHRTLLGSSHLSGESLHWYRQCLGLLYRTFWGTFAYLALPLPGTWYRTIGAAILLAALGWAWLGLSALRRRVSANLAAWQWRAVLLLGLGIAFDLALLLLTVMRPDRFWMPQGRYLFPLILPLAAFLALGWQSLTPTRLWRYSAALAIVLMFVYDTACLLYLIVPYCYTLR